MPSLYIKNNLYCLIAMITSFLNKFNRTNRIFLVSSSIIGYNNYIPAEQDAFIRECPFTDHNKEELL